MTARSRTRFKDERITLLGGDLQSNTNNASWVSYTQEANRVMGKYTYMIDVVGNRPKPQLGLSGYRFNPMSRDLVEVGKGDGQDWEVQDIALQGVAPNQYHWRYKRVNRGLSLGAYLSGFSIKLYPSGAIIMPPILDNDALNSATAEAVSSCLSDVGRGAQNNLYESLAELDKTLGMAASLFDAGRKLASPGMISKAQALGNAWLLYRYGYKPLVSDIEAILKALKKTQGLILETTRGASSVTFATGTSATQSYAGTFSFTGLLTRTQTVNVRAMSLNHYEAGLADLLGLGAKNLLTVPWELIPYSFVVDWFVNVGDFLGSIMPTFGVSSVGSCLVTDVKTSDRWMMTGFTHLKAATQTINTPPSGSCNMSYSSKTRTIGLPAPELIIRNDFKLSNLVRMLDANSLLLQRLRGGK